MGVRKVRRLMKSTHVHLLFLYVRLERTKERKSENEKKAKRKRDGMRERIIEGKSRREMRKEILIKMETISS